jgi:hypothetical protein
MGKSKKKSLLLRDASLMDPFSHYGLPLLEIAVLDLFIGTLPYQS